MLGSSSCKRPCTGYCYKVTIIKCLGYYYHATTTRFGLEVLAG